LSVAVFSITGGESGRWEIDNIIEAVRFAAGRVNDLRLIVFGRNAQSAEAELTNRFHDSGVELHVLGVLPLEDVVRSLSVSDVLLRVLQDEHYRASLAQRSLLAQRQYFSWPVIAARYAEFMRKEK